MKIRDSLPVVLCVAAAAHSALAANIEAGKAKVQTVCSACHGLNGISVTDSIPNLAAQKTAYIEWQLKALRDGSRKNAVMGAIASQLNDEDIANVAAYFAAQPGAATAAKSEFLPNLAKTSVGFPENYKASFVRYHTINMPATRQVRYYLANEAALKAAKAGANLPDGSYILVEVYGAKLDADKKPITGADGFFVPDQLVGYTAMARDTGWGQDIPDMLRNENWNYAAFTPAKQVRTTVNQAECLACHKPLDKTSYTFTLTQLTTAAKAR